MWDLKRCSVLSSSMEKFKVFPGVPDSDLQSARERLRHYEPEAPFSFYMPDKSPPPAMGAGLFSVSGIPPRPSVAPQPFPDEVEGGGKRATWSCLEDHTPFAPPLEMPPEYVFFLFLNETLVIFQCIFKKCRRDGTC